MKNEKKMNNKGFSLVELIIVIAIMAVLIAVLAPQYMRFIERGRVASDRDNIKAIQGALEVYYVDPTGTALANGNNIVIVGPKGGGTPSVTATGAGIDEALKAAGLINSTQTAADLPKLTNQETFSKVTITVNIDASNKTASISAVETP
ncbi:MAG: prepilin-type N-terminal cleavage/methylation domain-containing protein [Acetatifactor sp.]|nr:prepilin-type N-terminal cleavage/methylation domain-containing protein [Acetatifactor sp.]